MFREKPKILSNGRTHLNFAASFLNFAANGVEPQLKVVAPSSINVIYKYVNCRATWHNINETGCFLYCSNGVVILKTASVTFAADNQNKDIDGI